MAKGVVQPPPKGHKKRKEEIMGFVLWGWPNHPLEPWGGKRPKKEKKKNEFWLMGVAGPPA